MAYCTPQNPPPFFCLLLRALKKIIPQCTVTQGIYMIIRLSLRSFRRSLPAARYIFYILIPTKSSISSKSPFLHFGDLEISKYTLTFAKYPNIHLSILDIWIFEKHVRFSTLSPQCYRPETLCVNTAAPTPRKKWRAASHKPSAILLPSPRTLKKIVPQCTVTQGIYIITRLPPVVPAKPAGSKVYF